MPPLPPTTLARFAEQGYVNARDQVFLVAFLDRNFVHAPLPGYSATDLDCSTPNLVLVPGRKKDRSPIAFCWDVQCTGGGCCGNGRLRLERCGACSTFNSRLVFDWFYASPVPTAATTMASAAYCAACNAEGYYENGVYRERSAVPPKPPATSFQAPEFDDAAARARRLILK